MARTSIVPLSREDCADEFAGGAGDGALSSRIACEHGFMKLRACNGLRHGTACIDLMTAGDRKAARLAGEKGDGLVMRLRKPRGFLFSRDSSFGS